MIKVQQGADGFDAGGLSDACAVDGLEVLSWFFEVWQRSALIP